MPSASPRRPSRKRSCLGTLIYAQVVAPFFVALFALSGPAGEVSDEATRARDEDAPIIGANEASQALALALGVVAIASRLQAAFAPDAAVLLPFATLVAVAFATLFPRVGARLAPAGRARGSVGIDY